MDKFREFSTWNADQNLKTALRNSVNWYFQLLDGFSGADQLKQFYTGIDYENSYIQETIQIITGTAAV